MLYNNNSIFLDESRTPPTSSAPEDIMIKWYCRIHPEIEEKGLPEKHLVRRAKKEIKRIEEFSRAHFMLAVEKEKKRWWR